MMFEGLIAGALREIAGFGKHDSKSRPSQREVIEASSSIQNCHSEFVVTRQRTYPGRLVLYRP